MRCFVAISAMMLSATLAGAAAGQEGDKPASSPREGRPERAEMRERMIKEFDADGDGELNDEERGKAREARQRRARDGERGEGRRGEGRRGREGRPPRGPEDRGPEGRGPDGPPPGGPGSPHGPGFPPNPMRLFKAFDEDKNEQLSPDEFEKLMGKLRELGRPGPRGPGGPPEFRRRGGPDGPGPEGRPPRPREGDRGREGRRQRPPRDEDAEGDHPSPEAEVEAAVEKADEPAKVDDATA
jgi:hypothetical protein